MAQAAPPYWHEQHGGAASRLQSELASGARLEDELSEFPVQKLAARRMLRNSRPLAGYSHGDRLMAARSGRAPVGGPAGLHALLGREGCGRACLYAFDLLHVGADDLRGLALVERRALLQNRQLREE